MKKPLNQLPTEDEECFLLKEYLDILVKQKKVMMYTHLAQETFTKNWGTKMKNKKLGVHPGFPDYCILFQHKAIFIEMKRIRGGVLSKEQMNWQQGLYKVGIQSVVCNGFDEAKKFIETILRYDL